MAYSDVALLLALTVSFALAYPAKDDEAYYNRLREFQDYGKDVRNLDGIDARDEPRPLFSFLTKTDQGDGSEKGPHLKFDYGSSSHLDGIGGGHLVRELDLEQGLVASALDDLLPEHVDVGAPQAFGVVRKYPGILTEGKLVGSEEIMNELFHNPESARSVVGCLVNRCDEGFSREPFFKVFSGNSLADYDYARTLQPRTPRHMDAIGGGNLLSIKRSSDSFSGQPVDSLRNSKDGEQFWNYKKDLDSIGGGHLLSYKKDLDSIGGGHLLNYKKDLDSIGGGHLLNSKKDLDSIGGGHLLNYKKDLDSIGGGHLLNYKKDLDSIGGGHLLNYKKDLDSIGGGHLLNYKKDLDSIGGGHLLNYKKDLDSIGGGHLLSYKKDLDSIGGGHLLNYKKDLDPLSSENLLSAKRYLGSIGEGSLLNSKKYLDNVKEDNVKRSSFQTSPYSTYQKYYSGAGLPIKSSRSLCTSSRWFQNILNNYLAKEELKNYHNKYSKDSKNNKIYVSDVNPKGKSDWFEVHTPRGLRVKSKANIDDAGMKGLSEGPPGAPSDEDQTEHPFRGIIEFSKVYVPHYFTQNDR